MLKHVNDRGLLENMSCLQILFKINCWLQSKCLNKTKSRLPFGGPPFTFNNIQKNIHHSWVYLDKLSSWFSFHYYHRSKDLFWWSWYLWQQFNVKITQSNFVLTHITCICFNAHVFHYCIRYARFFKCS